MISYHEHLAFRWHKNTPKPFLDTSNYIYLKICYIVFPFIPFLKEIKYILNTFVIIKNHKTRCNEYHKFIRTCTNVCMIKSMSDNQTCSQVTSKYDLDLWAIDLVHARNTLSYWDKHLCQVFQELLFPLLYHILYKSDRQMNICKYNKPSTMLSSLQVGLSKNHEAHIFFCFLTFE